MDFIKTSSLRALIELTFQRNWNGLIWMSRKGVITKRVKTGPDGSIENQRQPRSLAEKRMFPRRPNQSVRLKSRPKFDHPADHASRPGKAMSRGRPSHDHSRPCRARPPHAIREATSRVRPRKHRPIFIRPTTAADHESVRPRPFRRHDPIVRPIVPTDRPTPRSTRSPFHYFQARLNPKPPLKDLALYI
ncbi:unnamed protein product [Microthlaspi erraticum]|uniref:Uncharacterized protein n=1 Tax=Microthlaspi erraticum TaxID=1685480 RepID=A0A6D2KCE4_9BRAS|nr:unnamed protein product [Microthlaspi erraticum]